MRCAKFFVLAVLCTAFAEEAKEAAEEVFEGEVLQDFDSGDASLIGLKKKEGEAGKDADKTRSAELITDEEKDMAATRGVVKIAKDLARMAFEDADGLTVAGFFQANDEGQVENRGEGSPYQVFRDSTMKNIKLPFAKITAKDVADAFGVKQMDTMYVLKRNEKQSDVLEIRKCQFFEDLSIFVSEDSNNLHGTYHKTKGFEAWGPDRALKHMKGEPI
jgi:hypothetical protein